MKFQSLIFISKTKQIKMATLMCAQDNESRLAASSSWLRFASGVSGGRFLHGEPVLATINIGLLAQDKLETGLGQNVWGSFCLADAPSEPFRRGDCRIITTQKSQTRLSGFSLHAHCDWLQCRGPTKNYKRHQMIFQSEH